MSQQIRQQEFISAYNSIVQVHGIQFRAILQARMLGDALQAEPQIVLEEVPDWTPPEEVKHESD